MPKPSKAMGNLKSDILLFLSFSQFWLQTRKPRIPERYSPWNPESWKSEGKSQMLDGLKSWERFWQPLIWKGLLLRGIPRIPNHQLTISWLAAGLWRSTWTWGLLHHQVQYTDQWYRGATIQSEERSWVHEEQQSWWLPKIFGMFT